MMSRLLSSKLLQIAMLLAFAIGADAGNAIAAPKIAEQAESLREAIVERDATRYRLTAFDSLITVRRMKIEELEPSLDILVAHIHKNGPDGVEPLLLALADSIATRAPEAARVRAGMKLRKLQPVFGYRSLSPGSNMKIPIARGGGYLALDVAPRVARLIARRGLLPNEPRGDVRSLLDVMGDPRLQADICDLPLERDQNGVIPPDELARQGNCADHGFAGQPGGNSTSETLGGMLDSACNLSAPDDLAAEKERLAALEQCMKERRQPGGPGPDVALTGFEEALIAGLVAGGVVLVLDKVFDVAYDTYRDGGQADAAYAEEAKEAATAFDAYAKAVDELGDAIAEEFYAEKALKEANEEVERAQDAAADAAINGTDEELEQAKQNLAEAKRRQADAQQRADDAKAKREEKQKEADKQKAKAEEEADEAEEARPKEIPDEDAFNSPACREAMGDPSDRLLQDKLGADWTDWRSRLKRVSNPHPDEIGPYDALNVPVCGADGATVHSGSAQCNMPVHCPDGQPDDQCQCGGAPSASAAAAARMLSSACAAFVCEDGGSPAVSPRGIVCECSHAGEEDDGDLPVPKPVLDALFGTSETTANRDPTVSVVRSLFDGQGHMPPN